jgi:hypothetical protein
MSRGSLIRCRSSVLQLISRNNSTRLAIVPEITQIDETNQSDDEAQAAVVTNTVQNEWSRAKPYASVPGPKAAPLLGNSWRFLPIIGKSYFVYYVFTEVKLL